MESGCGKKAGVLLRNLVKSFVGQRQGSISDSNRRLLPPHSLSILCVSVCVRLCLRACLYLSVYVWNYVCVCVCLCLHVRLCEITLCVLRGHKCD